MKKSAEIDLLRPFSRRCLKNGAPFKNLPRFQEIKRITCGLGLKKIKSKSLHVLLDLHDELMTLFRSEIGLTSCRKGEASLLDLKIEILHHFLKNCSLCWRLCWSDRTRWESSICGAGWQAKISDVSISKSPDSPLSPAWIINLAGSVAICRSCQKETVPDREADFEAILDHHLWKKLNRGEVRFLYFNGGNLEGSLPSIFTFLRQAPDDWQVPLAWNYPYLASPSALSLLEGVVDAYVLNLSYTCGVCRRRFSMERLSPGIFERIKALAGEQNVPVIFDCREVESNGQDSQFRNLGFIFFAS